jgi:hypothetical protein
MARSLLLAELPKFHVPFLAFDANETPPEYIRVVDASLHFPIVRGASRFLSILHPSGSVNEAELLSASHMESKFSETAAEVEERLRDVSADAEKIDPAISPEISNSFNCFKFI